MSSALDLEEIGESEIYKIDKLRAMHWITEAWTDILSNEILNFFMHTKLICDKEGSSVNLSIYPVVDQHRELEEYIAAVVPDQRKILHIYLLTNHHSEQMSSELLL